MSNIKTKDLTVFQLRAARRALNLTVREVSKDTSISIGVIVRSETGDLYSFPKKSSLISISRLKAYYEMNNIVFSLDNTISLKKEDDLPNNFRVKIIQ
ncbi:MAG: hypothetical protein HEEMFOPI_01561 [Holosporales bacterium]